MSATTARPDAAVLADALGKMHSYLADLIAFAEAYDPNARKRFVIETSPTMFLVVGENGKCSSSGVMNGTTFTKEHAIRIVRNGDLRDGKGQPIAATIRNVNAATRESIQSVRNTIEMLERIG